ncbi:hypothetical protein SLEP1_g3458 [Rubroshorea leprosula]|uniref:Reverse transcriptase domain-containing protein n=1 Tax=Rubroshorea leprosula TaxID=152421 RepID=A0AAV5HVY9_9ROSI|nr:hypothetical protein SLEP1_g3458 [Rubroshorea leprosula]
MVNKQPETSDSTGEHDTPVLHLTTNEPDYSELHRFSFAGQLLAEDSDIRSGLVYGILKSAWRPKGGLEVHEQSKNTFIFILSDETEKNKIFRESPCAWPPKGMYDSGECPANWVLISPFNLMGPIYPKRCGMLGHIQKSCDDFRWKDDDSNYISQPRPQYGPQLRTVAYSPKKHFGSIQEGAKSQPIYHAKLLPKALDKLETRSSSNPTISTQQRTAINEEDHSTMRREEQQEEERVNHAPALLSPALNAFEGQSPSDMITSSDLSAEPPPPSGATQLNRLLLLNEVMTTPQCFGSRKLPDSPSGIQEQATAQGGFYNSAELGLLLSHKVEAQLSLGNKPYLGKRRRCDTEPSGEPVKQACILPHEAIGQPCSSAQLQESLALGRSEFHKIGSDHCPLVLCLKAIPTIIKKQFRYELKWQLQNGYDGAVIQGWLTNRVGSPLFKMITRLIQPSVIAEMNHELCCSVSDDEIRSIVFQLGAFKAPGVDGFSGCFYQQHWDMVGPDVCKAVRHFFDHSFMPREMNKTRIVLVPKIQNPEFAFIPGRAIQDNILIAHEAFHRLQLKKSGKHNVLALKLDIRKAYDSVDWHCLESILKAHGFCEKWTQMVMQCVSTVSYTIGINGNQTPFFAPQRGLRRGDPLSPYLYLFIADILSRLLLTATAEKKISGYKIRRRSPTISHLLFADDSLVFCRATAQEQQDEKKVCWVGWDRLTQSKHDGGMGFKDLHCFNIAMLARQAWRILQNPNALWVRVLKSLYFPNSSFFDARKGSHPSWAWSSILHGRNLVQLGARWNVGNGQDILIYHDKWVPTLPGFKVTSLPTNNSVFSYVCDLFDDHGDWAAPKLNQLFSSEECWEILKIPTGSCCDSFIWHYDRYGRFSVKSAYLLAIHTSQETHPNHVNPTFSSAEWKHLWKLKVPPKIRVFL